MKTGVYNGPYTQALIDGIQMLAKAAGLDFEQHGKDLIRVSRPDGGVLLELKIKW